MQKKPIFMRSLQNVATPYANPGSLNCQVPFAKEPYKTLGSFPKETRQFRKPTHCSHSIHATHTHTHTHLCHSIHAYPAAAAGIILCLVLQASAASDCISIYLPARIPFVTTIICKTPSAETKSPPGPPLPPPPQKLPQDVVV